MKPPKFFLYVHLDKNLIYSIEDADFIPRFEIGDRFGLRPFDAMYDHAARAIVTDAFYDLSSAGDQPQIRLFLQIVEESRAQEAERHSKFLKVSDE
jgi:hypothetical protein